MKKNLCRAERINDRELIKGHVLILHGHEKNQETYCIADLRYPTTYHQVDPETVKRFSGFTDNNRVEVFEGDTVKFGQHMYQIVYEAGSFCLYDKDGQMINKIGGINDHCYSLFNLAVECCWEGNDFVNGTWTAHDLEVVKDETL